MLKYIKKRLIYEKHTDAFSSVFNCVISGNFRGLTVSSVSVMYNRY